MKTIFILLLVFIHCQVPDPCKESLDKKLEENETYISEFSFNPASYGFKEYYCPDIQDLNKAKQLLIEQYNYVNSKIPGGDKYFKPVENVAEFLKNWKIQYYSFFNKKKEKIIFLNLIKDTKKNKDILKDWRKWYVDKLGGESEEQLTLAFAVNISSEEVEI